MTTALSPFEADLQAVLDIADDTTRGAALAMLAKHLPGQHDQSTHGGGGGNVQELFARAEAGGFTYSVATGQFAATGYAVSPYPERSRVIATGDLTPEDIDQYQRDNADLLSQPGHNMGAWREIDGDTDRVWLDVSIVASDRGEAARIGRDFDQVSMFDLGAGETIDLGGTGGQKSVGDLSDPAGLHRRGVYPPIRGPTLETRETIANIGGDHGRAAGRVHPGQPPARPAGGGQPATAGPHQGPAAGGGPHQRTEPAAQRQPGAGRLATAERDRWEGDVRNALLIADPATRSTALDELAKHLPGKHDQSSHGAGGGQVLNAMGRPLRSTVPGTPGGPKAPRASLAAAGTTDEIAAVTATEMESAMGRPVAVSFQGLSPDMAREYGEGLIEGAERFPNNNVARVSTYGPGGDVRRAKGDPSGGATAHTSTHVGMFDDDEIAFNTAPGEITQRQLLTHSAWTGGHTAPSPTGVALHEFGHSVSLHGNGLALGEQAMINDALAAGQVSPDAIRRHIARNISGYGSMEPAEALAEAFSDVMVNGTGPGGASQLSKDLFDVIEVSYQTGRP